VTLNFIFRCTIDPRTEPEVQEKMHTILESNPDNLDEAIEQDPELKALRDANPLCAELMNDPETMKILVDPDNLRALAECPDLIEADFADPSWSPPEIENATFDETAAHADTSEQMQPLELDRDEDYFEDADEALFEGLDHEEETNRFDDAEELVLDGLEPEELEIEANEASLMDGFDHDGDENQHRASSSRRMQYSQKSFRGGNNQGSSMFLSARDYLVSELVGSTTDDFIGASALEDQATSAVDTAEENANKMEALAASTTDLVNDDLVGNVEDTMDKIEETNEEIAERDVSSVTADSDVASGAANGVGVASGAAAGGVVGVALAHGGDDASKRPSVVGGVGSFLRSSVTSLSVAAKEKLATTLLGDDLGETFLEKVDERSASRR
jgi:hypothetical protein